VQVFHFYFAPQPAVAGAGAAVVAVVGVDAVAMIVDQVHPHSCGTILVLTWSALAIMSSVMTQSGTPSHTLHKVIHVHSTVNFISLDCQFYLEIYFVRLLDCFFVIGGPS
jgi:hypothetical protein